MGTNHSDDCNATGKQIWEWCIGKKIWLSASYIPGKHNVSLNGSLNTMLGLLLLLLLLRTIRLFTICIMTTIGVRLNLQILF